MYVSKRIGVLELMAQGYVNPYFPELVQSVVETVALGYDPNPSEFGQNFHRVFPYVVMILFLMVRPYGILGTKEVERV